MTQKELESRKAKDLMKYATSIGVKGAWKMRKLEVIEAILRAEINDKVEMSDQKIENAIDKEKIDNDTNKVSEIKSEKTSEVVYDAEHKMKAYTETATIGMLVAFKLPDGKVKSAKIVKKSTKNRKFMVETEYNQQYLVAFEDILWVRTGSRWPKGIYRLLKGQVNNGEAGKA